jgi:hypothetical protein
MTGSSSKLSSIDKAKQKSKSLQFQNKKANAGSVDLSDNQAENNKNSTSATLSASSNAEKSKKELEQRKRSATANFGSTKSSEEQRARSATFNNSKKASLQQSSIKKSSMLGGYGGSNFSGTNFKHQIAYKKSLTLNLFEHKWKILHERSGANGMSSMLPSRHWPKSLLELKQLLKETSASKSGGGTGASSHHQETMRALGHTFWTAICLLESDYEHEFVIAIEIIEHILARCDLVAQSVRVDHKNGLSAWLEMFLYRVNWHGYPGLQNLLLKGCVASQSSTVDATHRLLVQLVPYCTKLNFIDPENCSLSNLLPRYVGLSGLALNLLAILPTMIQNYDKPTEVCVAAAEAHCKALREQIRMLEEQQQRAAPLKQQQQQPQTNSGHVIIHKSSKIEHLRNLVHILNMYAQRSFGKDRQQWTKCVITYLSEFFQQCELEQPQDSSK